MNISDLNHINLEDLAKIDYKKLGKEFLRRPDILAMSAAVIATVIFVLYTLSQSLSHANSLKAERRQWEEKIKKIGVYTATQKSFADFLAKIPPAITESQFVRIVTDLANTYSIQIISLNPSVGESNEFSNSFRIDLAIAAQDYDHMWRFLYAVEHSAEAIRVDNWNGSMGQNEKVTSRQDASGSANAGAWINARVLLTAINLKKP